MLVISRKAGESVKLSDNIEIHVISIEGGRVRIGVQAPKSVRIVRSELENTIEQTNKTSAMSGVDGKSLLAKAAKAQQEKS